MGKEEGAGGDGNKSPAAEDNNPWIVAGGGKKNWKRKSGAVNRKAHRHKPHQEKEIHYVWDPSVLDLQVDEKKLGKLLDQVRSAQQVFQASDFYSSFKLLVDGHRDGGESPLLLPAALHLLEEFVVYGLGSIENGPPACKYQFALAVNLAREIRRSTCLEAVFFDPAFTAYDRRVIESEGNFSVMRMDEKCARAIDRPTLFYMPHCEAKLYDSLLRANWSVEQLSKMVILGNSFASYELRWGIPSMKKGEPPEFSALLSVLQYTHEVPVAECNFPELSAFNDMSFHCFPREKVAVLFSH